VSAEDYLFGDIGDLWEDDRYEDEYIPLPKKYDRLCTICGETFKAAYPCACPTCGGWTDKK